MKPEGASAWGYRNGADIESDIAADRAAWSYRNGADIDSDRVAAARMSREAMYGLADSGRVRLGDSSDDAMGNWAARVDDGIAAAASRLSPADAMLPQAGMSAAELAARKLEVERQVRLDVLGEEARADSLSGAELFMTGGPARNGARGGIGIGSGGFEMVRNGRWDQALNIGADPLGLLGEMPGLQADLARLGRIRAESQIESMRQAMIGAGVKNVPGRYSEAWVAGVDGVARNVRDHGATLTELQSVYEGHVRDQRLRETWGADYQSVRIGKSQMSVMEFEKRVLDVHLGATNRAYAAGIDAIATGRLELRDGDYAKTLGIYIDKQVRGELRGLAFAEGINDSSASTLWAVNRRIKSEFVQGWGVPDSRLGFNLYAETTLARKNPYTEQLMRWNDIRPGNFLIMRPSALGGPYVIPRTLFPAQPSRLPGRGS